MYLRNMKTATMYYVKTQEAYNQLMSELEVKGYKWGNKIPATQKNHWIVNKEKTVIEIYNEGVKDIRYRNSEILDINQVVLDYNFDKTKVPKSNPIKVVFKKDIVNGDYIEHTLKLQKDNYVKVTSEKGFYWVPLSFAQFEVELHNWIVINEDTFLSNTEQVSLSIV